MVLATAGDYLSVEIKRQMHQTTKKKERKRNAMTFTQAMVEWRGKQWVGKNVIPIETPQSILLAWHKKRPYLLLKYHDFYEKIF